MESHTIRGLIIKQAMTSFCVAAMPASQLGLFEASLIGASGNTLLSLKKNGQVFTWPFPGVLSETINFLKLTSLGFLQFNYFGD